MRSLTPKDPIHPADCACPHCDLQLLRTRQSYAIEFALCGLIIAASVLGAVLAVFGTN